MPVYGCYAEEELDAGSEIYCKCIFYQRYSGFCRIRERIPGGGVHEGQGRAGNSNPFGSPIVIHRGGCALGLAAIPGTAFSRIECETVTPL